MEAAEFSGEVILDKLYSMYYIPSQFYDSRTKVNSYDGGDDLVSR